MHEKGGKEHELRCHHNLEQYLDEYIVAAGIVNDPNGPLFRTTGRKTGVPQAMWQQDAYHMIRRRAKAQASRPKSAATLSGPRHHDLFAQRGQAGTRAKTWPIIPRRGQPNCTTGARKRFRSTRSSASRFANQMADLYWQKELRERMRGFHRHHAPDSGPALSVKVRVVAGCFHREHSPHAYALITRLPVPADVEIVEHERGQ